jgi:thiamine biosynthesis lipoprotein
VIVKNPALISCGKPLPGGALSPKLLPEEYAQNAGRKPPARPFAPVRLVVITFAVYVAACITSCAPAEETRSTFALGTICTVSLFENGQKDVYTKIFNRLNEIETVMSANELPGGGISELGQINKNAGKQAVRVSTELITVLRRALYFAEITDGAFNPAIGPLVKLWGIGTENAHVPDDTAIRTALPLTDYHDVTIDAEHQTVSLKHAGMSLDLGGIAKGYAADEIVKILTGAGIQRAVIDLGGNIYAHGNKHKKQKWRIGVQNPLLPRGEYLTVEEAADKAIVTSGVYERFLKEKDIRYHHILDTKTGYPAASGILSVTIIAANSADADALSTATFVLGREKSAALLSQFPDTEAVFVSEDTTIERIPWRAIISNQNSTH